MNWLSVWAPPARCVSTILKLFSPIWLYLEVQFHHTRIIHPKLLKLLRCVPRLGLTPVFGLRPIRLGASSPKLSLSLRSAFARAGALARQVSQLPTIVARSPRLFTGPPSSFTFAFSFLVSLRILTLVSLRKKSSKTLVTSSTPQFGAAPKRSLVRLSGNFRVGVDRPLDHREHRLLHGHSSPPHRCQSFLHA